MNIIFYAKVIVNRLQKITSISLKHYATEASFAIKPFKLHRLEQSLPTTSTINRNEALELIKNIIYIRVMENEIAHMYQKKMIRGYCHLYIGQEACAVGIHSVMRPQDTVISSYRIHAWLYLLTKSIVCCIAELLGKKSGSSKGKGGSMHMYCEKCFGGNGIVGAQVPQGAGIALAHKYKGTGGVSITAYGDGAANQGQVFESFNMAKIWKLPCLFLCENNLYAMGTSSQRSAGNLDFYTRGDSVPGLWVDGRDVLSVRETAKFALEYCSSGNGPLLMEVSTYRFMGHSMSDPDTTYRTREEVKQARMTYDPVKIFKQQILSEKLAVEEDIKKIERQARKDVEDAIKFSLEDQEIDVSELTNDIYEYSIEKTARGVDPWSPWKIENKPKKDLPCTIK